MAANSERVTLRFDYAVARRLPALIADYASRIPEHEQNQLSIFVSNLKSAMTGPGDVVMDAPKRAWDWLIPHALHFCPDFCERVIVQMSRLEDAAEIARSRAEKEENAEALKQAADELRKREALSHE